MIMWIAALVLVAATIGIGYRQGAIRAALSFVGLIIAAMLALPCAPLVAWIFPLIGFKNPIVAQFGGRYLVRGGAKHPLEGEIAFSRIVVAEFKDVESAKRFYHSPEYQEARSHRLGAADFNMVIVEGA